VIDHRLWVNLSISEANRDGLDELGLVTLIGIELKVRVQRVHSRKQERCRSGP
jgi:hypothetical protein